MLLDAPGLGRGVNNININSSNWRDSEICELLTIMGEKVMRSHLTNTGKDGVIYEKDAERLSLQGFYRDKKQK